jgi:uncharacterized protein (TIGR00255 family)
MIVSMTGYGAAQCAADGVSYALEIRSVNHRYLKVVFKLPESLQGFEPALEKQLRTHISRGAVTFTLRIRTDEGDGARPINQAALRHYLRQLFNAGMEIGGDVRIDLATAAQLPGVCEAEALDDEAKARQWKVLESLTREAITALFSMRKEEGRGIEQELRTHVDAVSGLLAQISKRAPTVIDEYHERLSQRVGRLMNSGGFSLEADALAREVAIYAERCDITEEVSRLSSHLDQALEMFGRDAAVGRTLDFLAQELLREANTIASKSNDAAIARSVVEIKAMIDRIKEQVQNVE